MPENNKPISPEQVLMNCLGEAERIREIVVLVYTSDNVYEAWSNDLPSHVRLGILEIAAIRIRKHMSEAEDVT